ncbi:MAG: hypothetical protein ACJ70Z_07435 [Nitrososphaera sp.]
MGTILVPTYATTITTATTTNTTPFKDIVNRQTPSEESEQV